MKSRLPFRFSTLGLLSLAIPGTVTADPQIQVQRATGNAATTLSTDLDASAVANGFRTANPVDAALSDNRIGDRIIDASDAGFVVADGSQTASARGSSQSLLQSIAGGEQAVAALAVGFASSQATVGASLGDSLIGLDIDGSVTGVGGIALRGNLASASSRGNDARVALDASGSNDGFAGDTALSPDFDHTLPSAPLSATFGGDLIVAGVQQLDGGSAASATLSSNVLGLSLSGELDALSGGLSLSGNRATAEAGGNRLQLDLDNALAGGDIDASAGAFQALVDTDVTARVEGQRLGVAADADNSRLRQTAVNLDGNRVAASASGNRADAAVRSAADADEDSLRLDIEQFVSAGSDPALNPEHRVRATVDDLVLGVSQRPGQDSDGTALTLDGNTVEALASGNAQDSGVDLLDRGLASAATVVVEAQQSLELPGADLAIDALVGGSGPVRLGLVGSSTTGTVHDDLDLVLDGNQLLAEAVGNDGGQRVDGLAGNLAGVLSLEQGQTAQGSIDDNLGLTAEINDTGLGIGALESLGAPRLLVSDNRLDASATLNRQTQQLGAIAGSVEDTALLTISGVQAVDDAGVVARAQALRLGVGEPTTVIGDSAGSDTARVQVSGNRVSASGNLNRADQTLAGSSGNMAGVVLASSSQSIGAGGGFNNVDGVLSDIALGLSGSTASPAPGGRLDLLVTDNRLLAEASGNRVERAVGDQTGSLDGGLLLGDSQSASGVGVVAQAQGIEAGLTAADLGLSADTDRVDIGVSGNRVQALARQNQARTETGTTSGSLAGAQVLLIDQLGSGGFVLGNNGGVALGVGANVLDANDSNLALGAASDGTRLTVRDNQTLAEASANLATAGLGSVVGNLSGSQLAAISQSDSGGLLQSQAIDIAIGATLLELSEVGNGDGSLELLVSDNQSQSLARGNQASLALGGVTGSVEGSGSVLAGTAQVLGSTLLAIAGNVQIGVDDAEAIATTAGGDASLQVSGNRLRTEAQGNRADLDLGTVAGRLAGSVAGAIAQGFGDDLDVGTTGDAEASLQAATTGVRIGITQFGALGGGRPTSSLVDGNRVEVLSTANDALATGSQAGDLDGTLVQEEFQSVVGGAGAILSLASDIGIGVQGGDIGDDVTAAITGNAVLAVSSGNRVQSGFDTLAGRIGGTVVSGASQDFTGSALAVDGDLLATVEGSLIGVGGSGVINLPQASVSGNLLIASVEANSVQRSIGSLAGTLDGGGLALGDTQTLGDAVLLARTQDSRIGASLDGSADLPTRLGVSGNQVLAQALGNRVEQQLAMAGASSLQGADTTLSASQTATGGSVGAVIGNVQVGLAAPGAGSFTGNATVSGNRVGASALVNQAAVRRGGP